MKKEPNTFHVLSSIILNIVILVLVLCSDNPVILFGVFILIISIFICEGKTGKLKKSFIYFIPFAAITIIINLIFVQQGSIILFRFLGRDFTLESFIYAFILSFKLLLVIYIFMLLEIMIDSDKAVSFFSSVMPKSTLTLMISLKMFPNMKKRLNTLKEVYSIRGVDFEGKGMKEKIKSLTPLMSVMLEDSLEGSFDIGESSYVRGFLSGKRTVYDRQKLKKDDFIIIFLSALVLILYIVIRILKLDKFSVYTGIKLDNIINYGIILNLAAIILLTIIIIWLLKEKQNDIYRS